METYTINDKCTQFVYNSFNYIGQKFSVCFCINIGNMIIWPIPVTAGSKVYVYGRSPAEIVNSNPAGGMDVCGL